jgi:hypothetical protein
VLDRQPFTVVGDSIVPSGPAVPPDASEAGWKDTAPVRPGEILRVIARFEDYTGYYPYHCHILEHEDHEMMRQFQVVTSTAVQDVGPVGLVLAQNRPNPFGRSTTVAFSLLREETVDLRVFDVTGRVVARLASGRFPAGDHELEWTGVDTRGRRVSAGIYFVRLVAGDVEVTRKMVRSQ